MSRDALIWQEQVNEFVLELFEYFQLHPLVFEDEDEGYSQVQHFVDSRFDKFWPGLYTGDYKNYN